MWLLKVTKDGQQKYVVANNHDDAMTIYNALRFVGVMVSAPEHVAVHTDHKRQASFVVVDRQVLFLHPRAFGWEAREEPPEEVSVVGSKGAAEGESR